MIGRDTAVAIVVTTLFGLGVLLALSPATPPGLQSLLFGDVLGVSNGDLALAAGLVVVLAGALWVLHHRLLVVGFDRTSAAQLGVRPLAVDVALLVLLAAALLVAVQGLGNLLVVAVLIAPASAARLVARRMLPMMLLSAAIAVLAGIAGLYVSYHARTAAGASVAGALVRRLPGRRARRRRGGPAGAGVGAARCGRIPSHGHRRLDAAPDAALPRARHVRLAAALDRRQELARPRSSRSTATLGGDGRAAASTSDCSAPGTARAAPLIANDEVAGWVRAHPDRFAGARRRRPRAPDGGGARAAPLRRPSSASRACACCPGCGTRRRPTAATTRSTRRASSSACRSAPRSGTPARCARPSTGRPIPYIDQVAIDFPELVIVCGHIGYPWTEEMVAVARKHENVYIDTSAYTATRYPPELVRYLQPRRRAPQGPVRVATIPMIAPERGAGRTSTRWGSTTRRASCSWAATRAGCSGCRARRVSATCGRPGRSTRQMPRRARLLSILAVALSWVAPSGAGAFALREFDVGYGSAPRVITAGPDGAMWFTGALRDGIGRIDARGRVRTFRAGLPPGAEPYGIVAADDGNLWFTDPRSDAVGRVTPGGAITEYPAHIGAGGGGPAGIAAARGGGVWFIDDLARRLGRMSPTGEVTIVDLPPAPGGLAFGAPGSIVTAADGGVWFADGRAGSLARAARCASSRWSGSTASTGCRR